MLKQRQLSNLPLKYFSHLWLRNAFISKHCDIERILKFPKYFSAFLSYKALGLDNKLANSLELVRMFKWTYLFGNFTFGISVWKKTEQPFQSSRLFRKFSIDKNQNGRCHLCPNWNFRKLW